MLTCTCHAGSFMVFCGYPSEWRPNAPFSSIKLIRSNNAGEAELVLNYAIQA